MDFRGSAWKLPNDQPEVLEVFQFFGRSFGDFLGRHLIRVQTGFRQFNLSDTFSEKKLHPCIETLNSRNLGLAKDSFKVSFGFRTLSRPRLIKDPKNVKNHWFYCVFAQKC